MYRLAWIIVGCVTAHIASGYIAGFKSDYDTDAEKTQNAEGVTVQ
jgi:hypothetical protein